jgi:hypothetical protein
MNCNQCRQRILESLAAERDVAADISIHQASCAVCREFFFVQQDLFRSVDFGLRSIANQSVPPSLLASVRTQMDEDARLGRAWQSTWSLAVVATVLILAISISYSFWRMESDANSRQTASTVSPSAVTPQPAAQPVQIQKSANVLPKPIAKRAGSAALSSAEPEVIVLAEERQAFARFIVEMPRDREAAVALTRPAPPAAEDPVEIALLQIDRLDVKPLEPTATE